MNQRAPWTEEIRIGIPNVLPPPPGAGQRNAGPSPSANRRPEGFLKISLLILFLLAAGCAQEPVTKSDGDFQFPLISYRIRQSFANPNPLFRGLYHSAEDAYGDAGDPVYAIADGETSFSGPIDGYGWTIIIDHPEHDVYSLYAHVSTRREKTVSGPVRRGEVIAFLADDDEDGSGGNYPDWKPHLHFGLRQGKRADYPDFGDSRWMAGYTSAHPTRLGWLEPKKFIESH